MEDRGRFEDRGGQGTVLYPERNYLKYFSTSPFVSPHNLEI